MSVAKKMPYYDASKVREVASGRWLEVLTYLADNQLYDALKRPGKHVTCPVHGTSNKNGKGDGFRLFKDALDTGGGICATCGDYPDGFSLLMWLKGWDFRTTLQAVAEYYRVEPEPDQRQQKKKKEHLAPASLAVARNPGSSGVTGEPTVKKGSPVIGEVFQGSGYEPLDSQEEVHLDDVYLEPSERTMGTVVPIVEDLAEKASRPLTHSKPVNQPTDKRMEEIRQLQARMAERVEKDSAQAQEKIDRLWHKCISLENSIPVPLFRYFKRRAIVMRMAMLAKGDSIRFHPALPYWEEDENGDLVEVGKFPAMIAAVRNLDGDLLTLHRTYLTPAGLKAKVENPRKMMTIPDGSSVMGGAIQLGGFPTKGVMGIAEGIETSLSPLRVYNIPTWSAVSTTILERFDPPKGVHTVFGWEDKDVSLAGQEAMQVLKARLEDKGICFHRMSIKRLIPRGKKSLDWNDIMVKEGMIGFPSWSLINRLMSRDAVCAS